MRPPDISCSHLYRGTYPWTPPTAIYQAYTAFRNSLPNPLCAKFFIGNKNIFTWYVIPPHGHDTGSWNPSLNETRTYLLYIVNIMGADVLTTQGARASATMIFTILNQIHSVPARWGFLTWWWNLIKTTDTAYNVRVKTFCGLNKMAAIMQTSFPNVLAWKKSVVFWLNYLIGVYSKGLVHSKSSLINDVMMICLWKAIIWNNLWGTSSLMHTCITKPQWVNAAITSLI